MQLCKKEKFLFYLPFYLFLYLCISLNNSINRYSMQFVLINTASNYFYIVSKLAFLKYGFNSI